MDKNKEGKVKLNEEQLDQVSGGTDSNVPVCPLCHIAAVNNICENLNCRNYGSYIASFDK